jgi:hypothetical protein
LGKNPGRRGALQTLGGAAPANFRANPECPTKKSCSKRKACYETELADIKSDLRVLKWMVGTNFAGTFAILLKLFIH